jgi:hypothetical protein
MREAARGVPPGLSPIAWRSASVASQTGGGPVFAAVAPPYSRRCFAELDPTIAPPAGYFKEAFMPSCFAILLCALAAASVLAIATASAAEIDAASTIDAVTVYPDAAIVTRIASVNLAAGDNRVVFHDLPETVIRAVFVIVCMAERSARRI